MNKLNDKQYDFICNEINLIYNKIEGQRKSSTEFLKIYLSIILALFGYIYFVENRLILNGKRTAIPNDDYFIFGIFGVIITLIVFIVGWALLDNVTKSVYNSIKNYKHISNLRYIVSTTFEDDVFRRHSILPLKRDKIPVRISAQVPVFGALFNFGLLILISYFFSLFIPFQQSILITTMILTIISILYSNQLEKHFEEILFAQKIKPASDEVQLKCVIREFVKSNKLNRNYKNARGLYVINLILLLMLVVFCFLTSEKVIINNRIFYFGPLVLFVISIIPRFYMGKYRIEKIDSYRVTKKS